MDEYSDFLVCTAEELHSENKKCNATTMHLNNQIKTIRLYYFHKQKNIICNCNLLI